MRPARRHILWTAEGDALLGKDSDAKIAQRLGLCSSSVCARRHETGNFPKT